MQAAVGVAQLDKLAGLHRGAARGTGSACSRALRGPRGLLHPARGDARQRPELVRLRADRAPKVRRSSGSTWCNYLERAQDRHAPAVRRQPHPPAGVSRCRVPRGRRPAQLRCRRRASVLGRRLPGADRRDARLRRRVDPFVRGGRHDMKLEARATQIPGCRVVDLPSSVDRRGSFTKLFQSTDFSDSEIADFPSARSS